jgi:hypothetical protein
MGVAENGQRARVLEKCVKTGEVGVKMDGVDLGCHNAGDIPGILKGWSLNTVK